MFSMDRGLTKARAARLCSPLGMEELMASKKEERERKMCSSSERKRFFEHA